MKVLIVGSAGQVGRELVERVPSEWEVLALDRQALDITNAEQVNKVVNSFSPQVIINASAYTAVDRAETDCDQAYKVNRDGVANLAKASHQCNSKLIHISTDYVFQGDQKQAYSENDETGPTGVYGASKLAGEQLVANCCPQHIILRTAWVFGAHGNNFVKTMIRLAQERTELNVVGDQYGGPTYAGDIAETLLIIAEKICNSDFDHWGIYHYTGAPYTSWAEFARQIMQEAELQNLSPHLTKINAISTSEYPTLAKRPANSMLDCNKIYLEFGVPASNWKNALIDITNYAVK